MDGRPLMAVPVFIIVWAGSWLIWSVTIDRTTEMSSTLTAAGLGQSTAVSIGGDAIIGQTYAELMPLFEEDEQTEGIVIYTEPGGRMEAELARHVTEDATRKLPIVAFMAGRFMDEMPGMSFGHAGTIVEGKEDTAAEKIARLADAGITVAEEISEIPDIMKSKLPAHVEHMPPPGVSVPAWTRGGAA